MCWTGVVPVLLFYSNADPIPSFNVELRILFRCAKLWGRRTSLWDGVRWHDPEVGTTVWVTGVHKADRQPR